MSDKIKSIRSFRFSRKINSIMDQEISVVKSPLSHEEYDEDGILLLEESWTEGGALSEKYVYENINKKRSKQVIYLDEEEIGQTEFYTYNEEGVLIKTLVEYMDGSQDIISHTYDNHGNLLSTISVDEDDEQGQAEYWEYENNKTISYKKINDFGNTELEENWKYNEKGQLIETTKYDATEDIRSKITYEHDADGNIILESIFNHRGNLTREITYKYDADKRIISEQQESAKETIVTLNKYDSHGNQIESTMKNLDNDEIVYEVFREFNLQNLVQLSRVIEYSGNDIVGGYEVEYEYEFYNS